MKRNNPLFLLLFVVSVAASSCNKSYVCECREGNAVVSVTEIKTLGKMGAKDVCDGYQQQNNAQGARQVCSLR